MKKTLYQSLILAGLFLAASLSYAQTILTMTTLSAAVQGSQASSVTGLTGQQTIVSVASATNITAPAPITGLVQAPAISTFLFVDREVMDVRGVSGTSILVVRGALNTMTTSHASGALVFVIPGSLATWLNGSASTETPALPAGSCTRANEIALPRIYFNLGVISDCLAGQWANGDAMQSTRSVTPFIVPPIGGTLQTAIDTAGNAAGATTEDYCTQVYLPYSKYLTGLALLNGTTVGTNKWTYALYDSGGALLANTLAAGTLTSGASTYQQIAFTTPYYAVGPATYFACFQANGTTDTYRRVNTAANEGLNAGKLTGLTFGTVPASITVPSTFTTALGGYWEFY